jgi:hypothetical protein
MDLFSSVLTGSLQGIAERPLPCNYNVIQSVSALFTAISKLLQNPDDQSDYIRISQDVRMVEDLARAAIEEFLPA